MVKGDGTFEKGRMRKFYSSSKRLIDDMQEIFLKLGFSTTISTYTSNGFAKGTIHHLNIGTERIIGSRPIEINYKGYVYCVTVPNHIILVRRSGKIVWSGNCGYHGWADWYLSANLADDKNLDGHLLSGLAPSGVPRGLKGTMLPFHYNNIEELEEIVAQNQDIGVIVMEPMKFQAEQSDFVKRVREIADRINAVLIFDEITVGFRFNIGGSHLKLSINPDIAVFAKGISNGFPMGAVIGKKEIMQAAQSSFISSTYWTERIGPTAAIATINKMIKENVPEYLEKTGLEIKQGLAGAAKKHNINLNIEGLPAMLHISFDYPNSQAVRTLFTQEMLKKGVLAAGGIYVSLAFKKKHIEEYLNAVDEVFAILANAIEENKVEQMLEGSVAHSGFQRLN
ncbi:MAG: aminotransferase class III-fold pyridoxal phosphate-dependent enzyme [Candidatus Pacebacteria bacterium]|nr:aminotransferase class III-fold pyridoxal phosphate-dependent enzyme [Candidatus Paceibacterota bacterium]